jgi:MFS family permease
MLLVTGTARLWELLVLQAAHGATAAFFDPAATGLLPETVGSGRLQQANALLSLSRRATGILGQIGAGILVATVGAGVALGVDAASFAASACRLPCSGRQRPSRQLARRASSRSLRTGGVSSAPDRGCGHPSSTSPCSISWRWRRSSSSARSSPSVSSVASPGGRRSPPPTPRERSWVASSACAGGLSDRCWLAPWPSSPWRP